MAHSIATTMDDGRERERERKRERDGSEIHDNIDGNDGGEIIKFVEPQPNRPINQIVAGSPPGRNSLCHHRTIHSAISSAALLRYRRGVRPLDGYRVRSAIGRGTPRWHHHGISSTFGARLSRVCLPSNHFGSLADHPTDPRLSATPSPGGIVVHPIRVRGQG